MKQNFLRDHKNGVYIKMKVEENLKLCGVMASDKLSHIFLEFWCLWFIISDVHNFVLKT